MTSTSPTVEVSFICVEAQVPAIGSIGAERAVDLKPALMTMVVSPVNDRDVVNMAEGMEVKHVVISCL